MVMNPTQELSLMRAKNAALDGDALTALVLVCQGIRRAAGRHRDVAGFGHVDNWSRAED